MEQWANWEPQRFFYLFTGAAYLLVWVQVVLFHWRGAFRHWPMWGPVAYTPILAVVGIAYAFVHGGAMNMLFLIVYILGAVDGLVGVYYHAKGVTMYVGGWNLRNVMAGPPIVLTLIFFVLSFAALIVYYAWPA